MPSMPVTWMLIGRLIGYCSICIGGTTPDFRMKLSPNAFMPMMPVPRATAIGTTVFSKLS